MKVKRFVVAIWLGSLLGVNCGVSSATVNDSLECSQCPLDMVVHDEQQSSQIVTEEPEYPVLMERNLSNGSAPPRQCSEERIGDVSIKVAPVFDTSKPDEDNWLFRGVNTLHVPTRQSVIEDDLLFESGDLFDRAKIDESARILRSRRYFRDASITSVEDQECKRRVHVLVKDVWTLIPEISYSHNGGQSKYSIGLKDSNILGTGKTLSIARTNDAERTGTMFEFQDPNSGPFRSIIDLAYANNEDGTLQRLGIIRPFYAISTDWSGGLYYAEQQQERYHYWHEDVINQFQEEQSFGELFGGVRTSEAGAPSVHRWLLGFTKDEHLFSASALGTNILPDSRSISYPWIEYQFLQDRYIETENIQQIHRTEDINLGVEASIRVGSVSSGSELLNGAIFLSGHYDQGFQLNENQILLLEGDMKGYYENGDWLGASLSATAGYHWNNFPHAQFYFKTAFQRSWNPFLDELPEFGADTGLRGYPTHYQLGNRSLTFTVEQRYYFEREFFSLFHLGAVVFADAGHVQGDTPLSVSSNDWLRDVGFGLRISGTRTGNREGNAHKVLHLDFAKAIDNSEQSSSWQWNVKVESTF